MVIVFLKDFFEGMGWSPGGGYSIFFYIRRLGPSIYRSRKKKYQEFQAPQNIFEILATPQNIPYSQYSVP